MGQFISTITFKAKTIRAAFIVVQGKHECLLSYHTAKDLGVIAMLSRIKTSGQDEYEHSPDELAAMHPSLFSGKLGCITGVKIKLDIDPNVRPLKQSLRPVAIHLRDAVERELLKQLQQGIIERVEVNSDPSTWITNLVPVIKDRVKHNADEASKPIEVRLTTDSRVQNKAIRRARHPGKTIEELVYLVNGSNIFSKLDITKAFHQPE